MNSIIIFGLLVGSLAIGTVRHLFTIPSYLVKNNSMKFLFQNATGDYYCYSSYGHHHHDTSLLDCLLDCLCSGSNKAEKIKEKDLLSFIKNKVSIISAKDKKAGNNLTLAEGAKLEEKSNWYNTRGMNTEQYINLFRIVDDWMPFLMSVRFLQ